MRQSTRRGKQARRRVSVSTFGRDYPRGSSVPEHAHASDQLIYASRGVMQVSSGPSLWMIPPQFGLWIPARTRHQIRMLDCVSMRTLYLRPGLTTLRRACAVLHVEPLLREIILEIVRVGRLRTGRRVECALRELLVTELERASPVPTALALPQDRRALAVAKALVENPGLPARLATICASSGVSVRTLERVFRREVGTDFETWRRQARLMKAVELLVSGSSVKEAAFSVGYQQPNPLVTLFRNTFGATPRAWVKALERRSV